MNVGRLRDLALARVASPHAIPGSITHRLASAAPLLPLPRPVLTHLAGGLRPDLVSAGPHGILGGLLAPLSAGFGMVAGVGLAAIDSWALSGAQSALREAAGVIGAGTAPHLDSAWFTSEYWRVAGLAAMLTMPFLFAAAIQAILASDLALLARAAFCYLPLALLAVAVATPLTMLLLAATDQMCAVVSASGSGGGAQFLLDAAALGAADPLTGTALLSFAVGALTVVGALALAVEMLVREAAVYVVVLMLPLAFAAFVWPARRIWAVRMVELLVALILSKFAIVAVLSLAGAAFGAAGGPGPVRLLTAMALVVLAAFAPWGIVRMLPFTELASGAAGEIRSASTRAGTGAATAVGAAGRLARAARATDHGDAASAAMAADAIAAGQQTARADPGAQSEQAKQSGPGAAWSASDRRAPDPLEHDTRPEAQLHTPAAAPAEKPVDDIHPALRAESLSWKVVRLSNDAGWPPKFGPADSPARSEDDSPGES
jgi:hypothetical protein